MSKKSLDLETAKKFFTETVCSLEKFPYSFVYAGKKYDCIGNLKADISSSENGEFIEKTVKYSPDGTLSVIFEAKYCKEFGESEYTLYFENTGDRPTAVLRDVYTLVHDFPGDEPVLRGNLGDHEKFYEAYENRLLHGDTYFRSTEGRSTHIVFPYFDLVHGDGGTLMALGWAGTWDSLFTAHDGVTTVRAKTCIFLNACLLPGEKIRTGLAVMIPYKGRNADNATNLWREWFMKYNVPKMDAKGTPMHPFTTSGFAGDTGLPNSDGSISERYFTWKPTLDKLIEEKVVPDFRWFDAGWYCDPSGNTVPSDWWGTIGTWELDKEKWPGDSFKESNDACHKAGMKVFVWFEPERVTNPEELEKNYGYKKEWGVVHGPTVTSNIGNDECLAWTLNRIVKMMDENDVDMFREDNNSDPGFAWGELDRRDEEKYSIPRKGINENKCIWGHYKLWDGIISYCASKGKCTFVDSCASGGGRNDIESMRRGIPMMRSDYDRTTSSMRLSQTTTFCKWIPFHGSSTKETENQLDVQENEGTSPYVARASYLPHYHYGEAFTHNKNLDFDLLRRNIGEWRSINHLLVKDFYVLTPWHYNECRDSWTVLCYDDPSIGDSVLLGFRMEDAAADEYTALIPFAEEDSVYEITDVDTGKTFKASGKTLRDLGIVLKLPERKSSIMLRFKRI